MNDNPIFLSSGFGFECSNKKTANQFLLYLGQATPEIISISDYRDYKSGKENNGGCYWFKKEYTLIDEKKQVYEVRYETSAEFQYCEKYGNFCNCGYPEKCEKDAFITVSKKQIVNEIKNYIGKKSVYVDVVQFDTV